jgi:hypothetical protein
VLECAESGDVLEGTDSGDDLDDFEGAKFRDDLGCLDDFERLESGNVLDSVKLNTVLSVNGKATRRLQAGH